MKVILLRDVAKLGLRHSIVEVPDGYAQNKLIPQGLAKPATAQNIKAVKQVASQNEADVQAKEVNLATMLEKLATETVIISAKANEQGHLFQAVKVDDIVKALGAKGFTVEPDTLNLAEPIKSLGITSVAAAYGQKKGELKIEVVAL